MSFAGVCYFFIKAMATINYDLVAEYDIGDGRKLEIYAEDYYETPRFLCYQLSQDEKILIPMETFLNVGLNQPAKLKDDYKLYWDNKQNIIALESKENKQVILLYNGKDRRVWPNHLPKDEREYWCGVFKDLKKAYPNLKCDDLEKEQKKIKFPLI